MAQFFTLTPETANDFADVYSATVGRDMPFVQTYDTYILLDWTPEDAPASAPRDIETFPYGVYERLKDYRWKLME